ncbi:hypothetical protein PoB_006809900 [Plakobranchus ocellatus]|uniref:Uncharacterized protein n=1 Tax=Plakobranchus ocellatus TaxID=259542 RepID=A0AAV4DBQ6_9GAST|nr:hypothetical protein PoB_006809900 [Plakobranchus ocellatus]
MCPQLGLGLDSTAASAGVKVDSRIGGVHHSGLSSSQSGFPVAASLVAAAAAVAAATDFAAEVALTAAEVEAVVTLQQHQKTLTVAVAIAP